MCSFTESDSLLSLSQTHVKCLLPPSTVHLEELTSQTREEFYHTAPSEITMGEKKPLI